MAVHHIPYLYEYPLVENQKIRARPDFTVLNVASRATYYWEHLGMMDETEYLKNALHKISVYEKHGFFPGKNLILSFESSENPLKTEDLEALIDAYLKE